MCSNQYDIITARLGQMHGHLVQSHLFVSWLYTELEVGPSVWVS